MLSLRWLVLSILQNPSQVLLQYCKTAKSCEVQGRKIMEDVNTEGLLRPASDSITIWGIQLSQLS